jgi:hypothetical protein
MTIYEAIARYLKSKEGESDLNMEFYPSQAPDNAERPYAIFSIEDDVPETMFDGGFNNGRIIMQMDVFADNLTDLNNRVFNIKNHFVGRSLVLDSTVKMAYADSSNEFDAYDNQQKLYIRSLDLNIKYILTT